MDKILAAKEKLIGYFRAIKKSIAAVHKEGFAADKSIRQLTREVKIFPKELAIQAEAHWKKYATMGAVFLLIIVLNEVFSRGSLEKTLHWMIKDPNYVTLNWLLMMGAGAFLVLFTSRIFFSTLLVAVPTLVLGAVNGIKLAVRSAPLIPGDLLLVRELWQLIPLLIDLKYINYLLAGSMAVVAAAFMLKNWMGMEPLGKHHRFSSFIALVSIVLLVLGQTSNTMDKDLWRKGMFYSFAIPAKNQPVYDSMAVEKAEEEIGELLEAEKIPERAPINPNIIVIMSEAFWDVNKLGVTFTQNPIPRFEALRQESLFGEAHVPVFSGGTANTEYEILTGMSLKNYPNDWNIVYTSEITSPRPSLASILRKQGYTSIGLHPYLGWYYNRNNIYRHLGFHTFETVEYIVEPDLVGYYVSDAYVTQRIIEIVEEETAPVFTFALTMQNHGPFTNQRYDEETFVVKVEDQLSNTASEILSSYAQGLYLSDKALGRLVDFLKDYDEPTLLLFFGDHLPTLGEDHLVYRETGYIGNETNQELVNDERMMTVPYLIWSNYDTPTGEQPLKNISFLAPQLLKLAEKDMPQYLQVVEAIGKEMPVIMRGHSIDAQGVEHPDHSIEYQRVRSKYAHANQLYLRTREEADTSDWIITDNGFYNESLEEIEIKEVALQENVTEIKGRNFYRRMTLFVNGEKTHMELVDENTLILPRRLKPDDEVVLQLTNSEEEMIATSKPYVIPQPEGDQPNEKDE